MPGNKKPNQNPTATAALLLSLIPLIIVLAMLGLQFNVGPAALLYLIAQAAGIFLFFLMVVSSALLFVAWIRTDSHRDWRVTATLISLLLTLAGLALFLNRVST